ncbi:unnamed protein product [Urochloa decumbens]|uniref:Uncharacterized protein n=1 Tax=Urochloa decumbens TaxID=240449 RepID=A0ABC8YAC7_9POAL
MVLRSREETRTRLDVQRGKRDFFLSRMNDETARETERPNGPTSAGPKCFPVSSSRTGWRHRHHRRLLHTLRWAAAKYADEIDLDLTSSTPAVSSPSLSIWKRAKEMEKEEGLMAVAGWRRSSSGLRHFPLSLEHFMRSHVLRLLRTDLLAVLAELLRQDHVILSVKIYGVAHNGI